MPTIATLTAVALLSLGLGIACGWALGMRRKSKRDVIIDLETRLERAIESRADYEAEVAEHFARTAELLNRMTQDYREVYNHLASGAENLCDGEIELPHAGSLMADGKDAQEIPGRLVDVIQPLDYAPRKSPDEKGQLSETFGLERPATPETDVLMEPSQPANRSA